MDTPVHPRCKRKIHDNMLKTHLVQVRRKAKDQALENPAVWGALQKKWTRKRERSPIDDIAPIPKRVRAKPPVKSTSGRPRNDPSQSPTPPPPVWGSQFKSSSAKEKKYAAKVPMWDSPMTRPECGSCKVIQHGILEVKAYIAFKHGYPELVAKNSYAREILLQAAKHHKTVPIEKRMYVDDEYLSALANL
ncbi:hypothetical protein BDR07DRAFT_1386446, partial [Suillus spraguei]